MEVDRIHQVQGLKKVERTGSESERRKHQRPDEEFNEALEQSLKDSKNGDQHNGAGKDNLGHTPQGAPAPPPAIVRDTVSLSADILAGIGAGIDKVSISSAAQVSSESMNASNGILRLSQGLSTEPGLRHTLPPTPLGPPAVDKPEPPKLPPATAPPAVPGSLDKLA